MYVTDPLEMDVDQWSRFLVASPAAHSAAFLGNQNEIFQYAIMGNRFS